MEYLLELSFRSFSTYLGCLFVATAGASALGLWLLRCATSAATALPKFNFKENILSDADVLQETMGAWLPQCFETEASIAHPLTRLFFHQRVEQAIAWQQKVLKQVQEGLSTHAAKMQGVGDVLKLSPAHDARLLPSEKTKSDQDANGS